MTAGRRLLAASLIALTAASIPVERRQDAAWGVGLSTASCTEADCHLWSPYDCSCIDRTVPNRLPICEDPLSR